MKHILSKDFKYVPAAATDIRKTFARVRKEQEQLKKEREEKLRTISILRRKA